MAGSRDPAPVCLVGWTVCVDSDKTRSKTVKVGKRYCPHCRETLSYKTYRAHRRRYFDTHHSVWQEQLRSRQCFESSPPSLTSSPLDQSVDASVSPVSMTNVSESPPHFHHDILEKIHNVVALIVIQMKVTHKCALVSW